MKLRNEKPALYVDAQVSDQQDHLPEEIREYAAKCFECKVEVMEVGEAIINPALAHLRSNAT